MPVTVHASSIIPGEERMPIKLLGEKTLTPEEKEKYGEEGSVPIKNVFVKKILSMTGFSD